MSACPATVRGMAISAVGERWRGENADDIAAFLERDDDGYPVHQVVNARCAGCPGRVFTIELDESSTCARRTCVACRLAVHMLDSEARRRQDAVISIHNGLHLA